MEPNQPEGDWNKGGKAGWGDTSSQPRGENWERDALMKIALAGLEEQRAARRWRIFFRLLGFAVILIVLFAAITQQPGVEHTKGKHTALVDLQGIIAEGVDANADTIARGLRAAFEDSNTVGVLLRINSPGGSPVQSGYIYDEIRRLRVEYPDTPLYAVISDVGASGGYYVAAAADGIYADKASIVGSIGVRFDGFGFVDAMEKLGVERRLITAGDHKGMLDPFLPEDPEEKAHLQQALGNIHAQFVTAVKQGRGERLKDDPRVFSGLVWTGEQAVELGLIDGLGSPGHVAREVIGEEKIVDFTPRPDYFKRFIDRLGMAMAKAVVGMGGFTLR